MRHSELPPVLDVIVVDGNTIEICYRGTWADLCQNYVKSLPQNSIMFQEGNHAKPVVGVAGDVDTVGASGVGSAVRGKAGR